MMPGSAFVWNIGSAFRTSVLLAGAALIAAAAPEAARSAENPAVQAIEREVIPGADQMTGAQREVYRRRMEAAATPEERSRIRAEYEKTADKGLPAPVLVGDPARGAKVHGICFSCHGVERYVAPLTRATAGFFDSVLRASGLSDLPPAEPTRFKGKIKSLAALREAVNRRNDYLNPKMTPQEVEDVVAYLNVTYYKFPQ